MRLFACLATVLLVPMVLGQQKGTAGPSTMNKMLDNMKKLISNKMTRRLDRMSMKTAAAASVKPLDDAPSRPVVQSQPVITGADEGIKGVPDNSLTVSGDTNGMSGGGGSMLTIGDSIDSGSSVGVQMGMDQNTMVQQIPPQQQQLQPQQQLSFTDILFNALIVEELFRQVQQPTTNNNYGFDTGYQQPSAQTQSNDFAAFAVMDGGMGMGIMDGMI